MSAAAESLLTPRPTKLVPFVAISIGAHVAFAGLMFVISFVFSGPKVDLNQTPIKASLVRLGKPRDEKLLPRIEEAPPPPPPAAKPVEVAAPVPPTPAAVPIPTKDAKVEPKPAPSSAKSDKAASKSLFDAMNKVGRAGTPEDLEGQADGDPNGDAAKQEGERYFGALKGVVQRNYDVSDSIPEAERVSLRAEVVIRIDTDGKLLNVSLSKPSGNQVFDDAVRAAVQRSAPFGPPPDHLRAGLKNDGVAISFKP